MEKTTLAALSAFALVSSITPGPKNMMRMASGANFGLRRTVPHALGVGIGFTLMIVLVGVGLMGLFDLFPVLNIVLKVVSVAYLLWLAWRFPNPPAPDTAAGRRGKPRSFFKGGSEENPAKPQHLMRIPLAYFCLKKKKQTTCTSQN